MFSTFQLAKKYVRYFITASNGNGHGVHSPFVFDFIKNVLRDKKKYACYATIELQRQQLLQNNETIEVEDFGAGSAATKSNKRVIKNIAAASLKSEKYAQLLYRIVQYYQPAKTVELGTSLGITTAYLASGNESGMVYTCEGSPNIAAIAQQNFSALQIKNIQLTTGDFANTLQPLMEQTGNVDLVFIDGNHRMQPTLDYFAALLKYSSSTTILIIDDIHWSEEMEIAWCSIQQHPSVTGSIDLFFIGIVLLNPAFKTKQHFTIRF